MSGLNAKAKPFVFNPNAGSFNPSPSLASTAPPTSHDPTPASGPDQPATTASASGSDDWEELAEEKTQRAQPAPAASSDATTASNASPPPSSASSPPPDSDDSELTASANGLSAAPAASSSSPAASPSPSPAPTTDDALASSAAELALDEEEAKLLAEAEAEEAAAAAAARVKKSPAEAKVHDEREHINIVFIGHVDAGKCFAAGTRLRLHSGDTVEVERVKGGERLMGDDGSVRVVDPASIRRGRSLLYRIQPQWEGAAAFTVNAAHILVLFSHCRPALQQDDSDSQWSVCWWQVDTDGLQQHRRRYSELHTAEAELKLRLDSWQPLEWEVSVEDFLAAPDSVRRACQLYHSGPVTCSSPLAVPLPRVLTTLLGVEASAEQVNWAALYLGAWLCDGVSGSDCIRRRSSSALQARLMEYSSLFGQPVTLLPAADAPLSFLSFGVPGQQSVARQLLDAYDLLNSRHVPQSWLCDSLEIRRRILAAVIDSNCDSNAHSDAVRLTASEQRVADGYRLLASSLGIKSSSVCVAEPEDGFSVSLHGHLCDVLTFSSTPRKLCSHAADCAQLQRESRCYGFDIAAQSVSEYYGFAVQGSNRRFLLEDWTVTHNSTISGQILSAAAAASHSACTIAPVRQSCRDGRRCSAGCCWIAAAGRGCGGCMTGTDGFTPEGQRAYDD